MKGGLEDAWEGEVECEDDCECEDDGGGTLCPPPSQSPSHPSLDSPSPSHSSSHLLPEGEHVSITVHSSSHPNSFLQGVEVSSVSRCRRG